MRRRELIAATGIAAATGLAGCTAAGNDGETTVENVTVERVDERTVRASGTGSVETDPDQARFTVSVAAHDREDASAALEELAADAERLRSALLDYGVPEDKVTTTRYSLTENDRRNRYEGEHRYGVELDDPSAVGEVIDVCVEAGADAVGRIDFTVSEARREELYDEAVQEAVETAREEARLHATAAGQALGEPTSIETTQRDHRPFRQRVDLAFAESADESVATRIDEGQVAVTARVTVEYRLEPAG